MNTLKIPEPDLQVTFHHRLQEIRQTYLLDALLSTAGRLKITEVDRQLAEFVSNAASQRVAGWGLRGEAEKSHQKAKGEGYVECWTIVGVADLPTALARRESPTTDRFFHIDRILEPDSEEGVDFREGLLA